MSLRPRSLFELYGVVVRDQRLLRPSSLLQHPDDLIFLKPLALHLVRPRLGRTLIATGGNYPWQVTSSSVLELQAGFGYHTLRPYPGLAPNDLMIK